MRILPSTNTTFPKNYSGPHDNDYFINTTLSDQGIFNQFLKLIKYAEDNPLITLTIKLSLFQKKVSPSTITLLKLQPNITIL